MVKSAVCPEYDGTNAVHIGSVFARWYEGKLTDLEMVKYVRDHNVEYWRYSQFHRVLELSKLHLPTLADEMVRFCMVYEHWFGELPIKSERRKRYPTNRLSTRLVTYQPPLVKYEYGEFGPVEEVESEPIAVKSIPIVHGRVKPTTDDQRNGWYRVERQLQYIHWKEK